MTQEDRDIRISSALAILLLSIFLGMLINTIITPTIEDYIHGKVRVEINQVYENGEVDDAFKEAIKRITNIISEI